MATISTLAVNLIARTSAFEKGMRRSKKTARSFKSTVSGAIGTVANFAKGLALAAGVGGIGFLLKRTMTTIDATAKLSDRLGIVTEKLVGLRHAANIAGVSSQALDKSLEIFTRRMGEITTGSGEAKKGLELLGLSAQRMIQLSPEKSLGIIADRIKNLGTQAEKSAAAYFLFGRSGTMLLNLFEEGSEGLEAMQKEAEALGLTFNRIDARKIEAANDAITRLKGSMQGLVNEATIRLAPVIKKLTDFFIKYRKAITGTIGKVIKFTAKTFLVIKVVKILTVVVGGLVRIYKALAASQVVVLSLAGPAGWITLAASVAIAVAAIVGINEAIDGTVKGLLDVKDAATEVSSPSKSLDTLPKIWREMAKTQKSLVFWQNHLIDRGGEQALQGDVLLKNMKSKLHSLRAQINLMEQQTRINNTHKEQAAERARIEKQNQIALGGINAFLDSLKNQIDEVGLSTIEKQMLNIEKLGRDLGGQAFAEFNRSVGDAKKLIAELAAAEDALKEKDKKTKDSFALGRFQEIRSQFVDVAALNPTDSPTSQLVRLNEKTDKSNLLLEEISRNSMGVHRT